VEDNYDLVGVDSRDPTTTNKSVAPSRSALQTFQRREIQDILDYKHYDDITTLFAFACKSGT
jgi:hypothetical protein